MTRERGGGRGEALSGVAFMMLGVACFAAMDATGKWLVRGFSIVQVSRAAEYPRGDLPQPGGWLGVAIIVASGLYTIRRES